jgi:hypothetical protein
MSKFMLGNSHPLLERDVLCLFYKLKFREISRPSAACIIQKNFHRCYFYIRSSLISFIVSTSSKRNDNKVHHFNFIAYCSIFVVIEDITLKFIWNRRDYKFMLRKKVNLWKKTLEIPLIHDAAKWNGNFAKISMIEVY